MRKRVLFLCFVAIIFVSALRTRKPCRKLLAEYGYVCVCDENYCDTLEVPKPKANSTEFVLVTSSLSGDRFSYKIGKMTKPRKTTRVCLELEPLDEYQEIRGWGGAWTGAVTYLVDKLTPNLRSCFYKSYFSKRFGIGYSHIRIPFGGSDFDLEPWAYAEFPENDTSLSSFTKLHERDLLRNRQLEEMEQISDNHHIKYLAAAWTAPIWMKADRKWYGLPNNQLLEQWYQTWADYHLQYLSLMEEDGFRMWAISTGNEPIVSKLNDIFAAMNWNISNHAKWIAENLGPTLGNSKYSNVKIFGFDENRYFAKAWLNEMENSYPEALNYLSAIQYHAYSDNFTSLEILDEIQNKYPDKDTWYSEMCFGTGIADPSMSGPRLGLWSRADPFIKILFDNFAHSINGYIDWNLMLNSSGGPRNTFSDADGIGVDAPIILSKHLKMMFKQPLFYATAHFAKFIQPGSVRIDSRLWGGDNSVIKHLAFKQNGKITVVLYNNGTRPVDLLVLDDPKKGIEITLKPNSLNTLIYRYGNDHEITSSKHSNTN